MRKPKWNLENIKSAIERFNLEHNRYPTAKDFDSCSYLPWSRQLQRRFGGLVELRQLLKIDGPSDFTVGKHSSDRARTITKRSNLHEKEIYNFLVNVFGKLFVHREYLFNENKRVRTDFFVYHRSGQFAVDAFYPKDRFNLIGCINSKLATYDGLTLEYPVIFLMLNKDIDKGVIRGVVENKRKKLEHYQQIMNLEEFEAFCYKQQALHICTH